jgi:hypothetical protein
VKRGRKSKAWDKTRAELKKRFEKQGITFCESCGSSFGLTFAHRLKRRFITTPEELYLVALLCLPCHQAVEVLPHEEMYRVITELIENRNVQITTA